jgi:thermitase
MNARQRSLITLSFSLLATAHAEEYVVKYSTQKALTQLKKFGVVKSLNLRHGQFALVTTSQKGALSQLNSLQGVDYAEPNYTYQAFAQDTDFKKQWGLNNDGRNSGGWFSRGVAGMDVGAINAWKIEKGSAEIKIAVIDTGVDYRHQDLKNQIMINEAEQRGQAGVDDDQNGFVDDVYGFNFSSNSADPMDDHGHGTHCAGVIGAEHNSVGIAGVMAEVKILPIKFLSRSGSGTLEGALKSIDYAITREVNIMSNSWGGGAKSEAMLELIKKAEEKGILFIAAAGNSSSDNDKKPTYPANYEVESLVSVGAIDGKGKPASFTNTGKKTVHVFAPGVDTYSTVQNNGYKEMSGTSMACPHVAGIAGLILARSPGLSPLEIKQTLMTSARRVPELNNVTASGLARADAALK